MGNDRPAIPALLRRAVKDEAGYRCAIPTCRGTVALEVAHIVPWAQVKAHAFENLLLLCATCHTMYDTGLIDRKSIRQYKANLAVINGRYNDFEQRLLRRLHGEAEVTIGTMPGLELLVQHLLDDGLVEVASAGGHSAMTDPDGRGGTIITYSGQSPFAPQIADPARLSGQNNYRLTDPGRALVTHWYGGQPVDPLAEDDEPID